MSRREQRLPWSDSPKRKSMMLGDNQFVFLNEKHVISTAEDWNNPEWSKLWLYNLHYFDDLNAESSHERADWHNNYLSRWVAENPPVNGNGWEPYPSSLRIVNWIKWAISGNELQAQQHESLVAQVRHLNRQIEWHILGNHIFANAKALIFAGLFYDGSEADDWLKKGEIILAYQLNEQILSDGAHFELSPMYHNIILEDLLDLINLMRVFRCSASAEWERLVPGMVRWSLGMMHPDRDISFFNDAATQIALSPVQLHAYAKELALVDMDFKFEPVEHFEASGYVRMSNASVLAILDVAEVGPDYLPGHAHADSLSFELSLFGQRLIVNSGTSMYGTGPERLYQRSTAAHSTVVIDGQDSSEVWGGFRVAKRARPSVIRVASEDGVLGVKAKHDGYLRLKGEVMHCRSWSLARQRLEIVDTISGNRHYGVDVCFLLHPEVEVLLQHDKQAALTVAGREVSLLFEGNGSLALETYDYHPQFGVSQQGKRLIYHLDGQFPEKIRSIIRW